eukprot:3219716-Pyramimonas_sp.AAC.1
MPPTSPLSSVRQISRASEDSEERSKRARADEAGGDSIPAHLRLSPEQLRGGTGAPLSPAELARAGPPTPSELLPGAAGRVREQVQEYERWAGQRSQPQQQPAADSTAATVAAEDEASRAMDED